MRFLLVGGGGREHAIAWKLAQSPKISRIYCAPGNAGIEKIAECVPISATDLAELVRFSQEKKIDRVFVAPDDPLALGLVDALEAVGIRAFGPNRKAARIEASKAFAKKLMQQYHIPTADFRIFHHPEHALAWIDTCSLPVVIKADGLALGKGVLIAQSRQEAREAVKDMMLHDRFGSAGKTVVIEEFLTGKELTVLAFTDGRTVKPMVPSRDHKRALDGDQGQNTGGMGAIAPAYDPDVKLDHVLMQSILLPTIKAMRQEGCPFKGVLYFGLMLTPDGPKVIEYNARLGDPEAQVVLPLLKTDLVDIIDAVLEERLDKQCIEWSDEAACCVVAASGGYPVSYQKGFPISGLDRLPEGCLAFHAGTTRENGMVKTAGGRVLGITAIRPTREQAIDAAYEAIANVSFKNMHYRTDIGRT